jgi:hypothetical protein
MTDDTYHGTRGHSGGDASRDAAIADRDKGTTNEIQEQMLRYASAAGRLGVTALEARRGSGHHHGRVSSALTKLHIAGKLVALAERRNNGGIYVTPENVDGREVREYRRAKPKIDKADLVATLEQHRPIPVMVGYWRCDCSDWRGAQLSSHREHVADVIVEEFGR